MRRGRLWDGIDSGTRTRSSPLLKLRHKCRAIPAPVRMLHHPGVSLISEGLATPIIVMQCAHSLSGGRGIAKRHDDASTARRG